MTADKGNCFLLFTGHRRSVSRSPPRRYETFLTGLYQPEMASSADCLVENPQISRTWALSWARVCPITIRLDEQRNQSELEASTCSWCHAPMRGKTRRCWVLHFCSWLVKKVAWVSSANQKASLCKTNAFAHSTENLSMTKFAQQKTTSILLALVLRSHRINVLLSFLHYFLFSIKHPACSHRESCK